MIVRGFIAEFLEIHLHISGGNITFANERNAL